jgi:hypothetical protein
MTTQNIPTTIHFCHVYELIDGFNKRFPNGNSPYQMIARLCEEGGELAEQVNSVEDGGLQASGRSAFAKEIEDVIRALLSIQQYYHLPFDHISFDTLYRHIPPSLSKSPFQLISSLCAVFGNLSKKVNHAEGMGVKLKKYGELDTDAFAQLIEQAITLVFSIARHYHLEDAVQESFLGSYRRMCELGYIM